MAASYHVYNDQNLLYVRYDGHHSTRQLNDLVPYYSLDPYVHSGLRIVVDCARLNSAKVDLKERRKQMVVLYDLLKYPGEALNVTYFCPNAVGQDLSKVQEALWDEFEDVQLMVAKTVDDLAEVLREPTDFLYAMLGLNT
ncbi:hypothetical protein [Thalassobius sp. Cn5-15]|uniref:hypothetical protein n=1 Tax=Thalassobius sp. Cn5-15 TaxID=2917763 RepID=UPI001EF3AACF|nr:hypothetical protein [Thalassobius sp. Cn5-15]MCG7492244.1 hypothetical protein [Thalassobius sp. Cn5-15]